MANQAKGPVIFLILIVIAALFTTGLGYLALQKEKQNNEILSRKITGLEEEKQAAENSISKLKKQLEEVQKAAKESDARLAQLNAELLGEKKAKDDALAGIIQKQNEINQVLKAKADLESRLKEGDEKLINMQKELVAVKSAKDELEQKLKDIESKTQSVQLDKIVVSSSEDSAQEASGAQVGSGGAGDASGAPAKPEGKVLVVNGEYDFIVVNLGRKDNMNVGDILNISRKNKKIGQAKVEEVRDTMSVATPTSKGLVKQIKEEDKVIVTK